MTGTAQPLGPCDRHGIVAGAGIVTGSTRLPFTAFAEWQWQNLVVGATDDGNPMPSEMSAKQQRDARRAEKVATHRKADAARKRGRVIAIIASAVVAVGILALIVTVVMTSATPKADPASIQIKNLTTFDDLGSEVGLHVDGTQVDYEQKYGMNPPAGGEHWSSWLNCGVYSQPQQSENAVHALEHGALWVTYDPDALSEADVQTLRDELPATYVVLSPYPGLPAPVVASGWENQIKLDGVDDPRLAAFVAKFWKSADAPEPGAPCTGGVDGPGLEL